MGQSLFLCSVEEDITCNRSETHSFAVKLVAMAIKKVTMAMKVVVTAYYDSGYSGPKQMVQATTLITKS